MIKVLDHGYLTLIESWGSDERIIEAARMSTNKGFQDWGHWVADIGLSREGLEAYHFNELPDSVKQGTLDPATIAAWLKSDKPESLTLGWFTYSSWTWVPGDEKLLRYLYEHKHSTPFEMAGMIIEVQAPIFVFREWHRHRTQSYNELSARYTKIPNINYVPQVSTLQPIEQANKQAKAVDGAELLTIDAAKEWLSELEEYYETGERLYAKGLRIGVKKESARLPVTVGRYSRMRASANLRNWLGFLTLRMDKAAQWEIREYANAVGSIIAEKFPRTWELFAEGRNK